MKKLFKIQKNNGMTYVEIIVVLSIFFVMTSIILFNYREFQAKVDIKNFASDIASKVVEAQKSSLVGKLPPSSHQPANPARWKPSYGVYFDTTTPKQFIYFTDLDNTSPPQNNLFDGSTSTSSCNNECLDKITITKNNSISDLKIFGANCTTNNIDNLTIVFRRPDYRAIITSEPSPCNRISQAQISVVSPQSATTATIKIYSSGRIQVN